MRALILIGVLSFITACGGGSGGGSSTNSCTVDVTSHWGSPTYGFSFDLSSKSIGTFDSVILETTTGEQCELTGSIVGEACSGSMIIGSSNYIGGGSGDPGCSTFIEETTYSITGSTMRVCNSVNTTDCVDYYEVAE